jgi:hypothetical protein
MSALDLLNSPAADSNAIELADWLELQAFFSEHYESRLDEVDAINRRQEEEQDDDIAEQDSQIELRRSEIENELTFRKDSLKEAYPFVLSEDGERVQLLHRNVEQHGRYYLLCLILSHATRSPFLQYPPINDELAQARKVLFQVLSNLALAGETQGQAVWLGWPRDTAEKILDVVRRACEACKTGKARNRPASMANPSAKDGGVDVLSWPPFGDRPPPTYFMFGQAASGLNWSSKPSKPDAEELLQHYFDEHPQCDLRYATVIPFRISDEEISNKSRQHGSIFDRTRAPLRALIGYQKAVDGTEVDGHKKAWRILIWIFRYRRWALQA